jgi:hypothetical protein
VPPYSSTEPISHCTPQARMLMSNCYSQVDIRDSANFGQSLYTTLDSIRMKIALNMVLAPPVASSAFHLDSPVSSRVEESSANTPAPGISKSNFNKDNNIKPTYDRLTEEDRKVLEAYRVEVDELFFSRDEVM